MFVVGIEEVKCRCWCVVLVEEVVLDLVMVV